MLHVATSRDKLESGLYNIQPKMTFLNDVLQLLVIQLANRSSLGKSFKTTVQTWVCGAACMFMLR